MSVIVLDNGHSPADSCRNNSPQSEPKYPKLGDVRNFINRKYRKQEEFLKDNLSSDIVSIHEDSLTEFDDSIEIIGEEKRALADKIFECEESVVVLDDSIEVIEREELLRTPKHGVKRRRGSSDSSLEESPFNSPEIPLTDSPVIYQLSESHNTKIIIKKSMSQRKPDTRLKKCTEKDISTLLDTDEDEDIFDKKKTPSKKLVKNNFLETRGKEEGSIRMRLRRSTEQSNYRVENLDFDSRERRSSLRTKIVLPSRYRNTDLEDEKPGRKTPSRSARSVQYYEEKDSMESPPEERTPKKLSRARSSQSSVLKSVPSGRARRSTRLNRNVDSHEEGANENDTNKSNKSDESDCETGSKYGERKRRLVVQDQSKTPKKSMQITDDPKTPKRTPRRVHSMQEESTPRRSTKHVTLILEEPATPKQHRPTKSETPSRKHGSLTPSMHQRLANVGKPRTILQEARAQLHVSAVPKSLPCREEEFNNIFTFLQRKLIDHSSGCIYISGVPGTGKTATVNEVIKCLKKLVTKRELDEFNYLEINGMKLTEPRQAYVQILKQLTGRSVAWEQAYQSLDRKFGKFSGERPMTLLLVDELDLLCNKRQDVVYNILDWPAKQGAQLVVITIANTMDLPERVLMGRVTSRLGLTRLTFQPYNHKQLQEIVTTRLDNSGAFRSEAVQLVARKVAAVSGDARRALDICRRATEITESHGGRVVSMQDVNEALTEMIASAKVQAIKHCSEMEKVLLQAVCAEISRTGIEEVSFQSVYRQFEALCSFEGVKTPNISQSLEICSRLGANRLLLCEHSRSDVLQRILLNVSADDIHFALQSIEI